MSTVEQPIVQVALEIPHFTYDFFPGEEQEDESGWTFGQGIVRPAITGSEAFLREVLLGEHEKGDSSLVDDGSVSIQMAAGTDSDRSFTVLSMGIHAEGVAHRHRIAHLERGLGRIVLLYNTVEAGDYTELKKYR